MLKILFIISFLLHQYAAYAQLTLNDAIERAKKNSFATRLSQNEFQLAELDYAAFKTGLKSTVSIYGNIPVYNKDNYAVIQPDGTIKFLRRSQNYSNAGIGFRQPIPFTGGMLDINSDLYRFDDFVAKTKQYNGAPVFVRLTQPLFKFNPYKRDKQVAPMKLQEAMKTMSVAILQMEYDVCRLFFDIAEAQINKHIATANIQYTATNLSIEKRRVQLGVSTEDKVLELEIQLINYQLQQIAGETAIRKAFSALQLYTNSSDTTIVVAQIPGRIPDLNIDNQHAIASAKQNLPQYLSFQRKKIEAQSKIEEARSQGRQVDLVMSYGLNNAALDIPAIYRNPQDQQRFSLGFSIPIADWGRRRNSLATAKLQDQQSDINNKQEEAKLISEISDLAYELSVLKNSIQQSLMLDTLSEKRFVIINRLFQSGKASLLELQAAQIEKDNARRSYITAIRMFWESYYLFRVKTGIEIL